MNELPPLLDVDNIDFSEGGEYEEDSEDATITVRLLVKEKFVNDIDYVNAKLNRVLATYFYLVDDGIPAVADNEVEVVDMMLILKFDQMNISNQRCLVLIYDRVSKRKVNPDLFFIKHDPTIFGFT